MSTYEEEVIDSVSSSVLSVDTSGRDYPTDGLLARWQFEEGSGLLTSSSVAGVPDFQLQSVASPVGYPTWSDLSVGGRWGISIPGPVVAYNSTGASGLPYANHGAFLTTSTTASVRPITKLTMSAWVYKSAWASSASLASEGIFSLHSGASGGAINTGFGGCRLILKYGVLRFEFVDTGSIVRNVTYTVTGLSSGWHLLTGTFDGQYLKIYVDKTLVAITNIGSIKSIKYYGSNTCIAAGIESAAPNYRYFYDGSNLDGVLDEIAVWDYALLPAEISGLWNATWHAPTAVDYVYPSSYARYGSEYYPECFAEVECFSSTLTIFGRVVEELFSLVNPVKEEVGAFSSETHYEFAADLFTNTLSLATTIFLNDYAEDIATFLSSSAASRGILQSASDTVELTPTTTEQAVFVVLESISVVGSLVANGTYNQDLLATVSLRDRLFCTWLLSALEELEITASISEKREVALALLEKINASAFIGSEMLAVGIIAVALALQDTPLSGKGADAVDGTEIAEIILTTALMYAAEIERAQFEATIASQGLLSFSTTDKVFADANLFSSGIFKTAIEDGVSFAIDFGMDGQIYSAYVMNTKNFALSEYQNFPFNSFAKVGTQYYAASETGLYLLDGSTDAGEDIQATITLGAMDFTGERKTNVCEAFLALRNDGEIAIKVKTDDNKERWYRMSQESDVLRDRREKFARGVTSRFWTFSLENIDGADFEVHEMTFLPLVMKRRI